MGSTDRTNGQVQGGSKGRVRTLASARSQQEAQRLLLERAPAVLWTTDTKLRLTHAAGAALDRLELASDDVAGLTLEEFLESDDPEYPPIVAHRRVLAGKAVSFETDWHGRHFTCRVEPLWGADDEIIGCVGYALDITDHRRGNEIQAAQAALTQAQVESHPPDAAAPRLLQALCEGLDWDLGVLWLVDSNAALMRCQGQWYRPGLSAQDFASVHLATVFGAGEELPGRVWSSGRPLWVADVTKDSNFSRTDAAAGAGFHAACLFPIVVDRRVLGVVELFASEARQPDPELLAVLAQLGTQVGLAVERLRVAAMLEEHKRLLGLGADVGRALGAAATLRDMLRPCAEAMLRHLNAACALIWTLNEAEDMLELQASARKFTHAVGPLGRVPVGALKIGPITTERRPHLTNDVLNDPWVGDKDWVRREGLVSFAGYPLLVGGRVVGVAALFARHPLTEAALLALGSVADQIALGIQRKRAEEAGHRSEQRFRSAFANASVGMVVTDLDSRFLEVNPAFSAITGYTAEELAKTDFLAITHLDDRDKKRVQLRRMLSGEVSSFVTEKRYLRKGGETVWAQASISLVRDPEGRASQIVALVEDVTRRRRAMEAVRTSEARKTAILENALDAIITMDGEGRIVEFNPAAERTFGYRRAEAMGKNLAELLIPAALREQHRQMLQNWLAAGRGEAAGRREEIMAQRADGSQFPAELTLTRIPAAEGPLFTLFLRELSGAKLAESEREGLLKREQAARAEAEAAAARAAFLAEASAVLDSSLDYKATLQRVAHLAVPKLADFCMVDVIESDGTIRCMAVATADPAKEPLIEQMRRGYPARRHASSPAGRALTSGRLEHFEFPDEPALAATTQDAEHLRLLKALGPPGCALAVPLIARGRTLGVITLAFAESSRAYREEDRTAAQDLARRCALAVDNARLYSEAHAAEESLRRQLHFTRALTDSLGEGVCAVDREGRLTFLNPAAEELLGWKEEELLGQPMHGTIHCRPVNGSAASRQPCPLLGVMQTGRATHIAEDTFTTKAGQHLPVACTAAPILDQGQITGAVVAFQDIGERKRLEEQLRQAQKMEAVGRLAGGVAHDFNNLLTVITGYSDLLLSSLQDDVPRRLVAEIKRSGERATSLTQQLLAFGRKQVLQPRILDVNAAVSDAERMLRRIIGEDIELLTNLDPSAGKVRADPTQVEQVLLNLAVNARDAMPQGGKLMLQTANTDLDSEYARFNPEVVPGPYVMVAVSDTGCGMGEEVRAHLFEPFFTTKEQGKGTGLGLATVYGIVKQSGGHIDVESALGRGTTFRIFLPRTEGVPTDDGESLLLEDLPQGDETILLVEDEEGVRSLARLVLEAGGYSVLQARDGREALGVWQAHDGPIHLLVTDVVMPQMSGRELVEELTAVHPELRVLYLSGYPDEALGRHGVIEAGVDLLTKPFSPLGLSRKVREILDRH